MGEPTFNELFAMAARTINAARDEACRLSSSDGTPRLRTLLEDITSAQAQLLQLLVKLERRVDNVRP